MIVFLRICSSIFHIISLKISLFLILWFLTLSLQLNNRFKKKIPAGTEVANILVGEISFLEKPFIAFVRLQNSVLLGSLTEVAFPSR